MTFKAVHRTILVVDVEGFGAPTRTDRDRLAVRQGLYSVLKTTFENMNAMWDHHEDCGDGLLILVHPRVPKSVLVDDLPDSLAQSLESHNERHPPAQNIRLRVALHAGEVHIDETGVTATAVNVTFRLIDSDELRHALRRTPATIALIVSSWFFDEVVKHSLTSTEYRPVRIEVKETSTIGWIRASDGPDLPSPVTPNQLPAKPAHFSGREDELVELNRKVNGIDRQLFVITGPGGMGKTALALHWMHQLSHRFTDGSLYANLGADALPGEVLGRLLHDLGVSPPQAQEERKAVFRTATQRKYLSILLDDAASAAQVRELLPATGLVVVTTRRQLPGLIADGAEFLRLEPLDEATGVQVLAAAVGRRRVLSELVHAESLVRFCAGMPLALTVVAAQLLSHPHRTLRTQVSLLQDNRTRLARLSIRNDFSVWTVIDMSYQALTPETSRLYRLLGLHLRPEFPLGAAAAAAGRPADESTELLDELLDANLLEEVGDQRFRLPELMHLFARERAEAEIPPSERTLVSLSMTEWYLTWAKAADRAVRTGHRRLPYEFTLANDERAIFVDRAGALAWLEAELPNIVAEARRAIDAGQPELSWQLCDTMWSLRFRVDQRASLLIYRTGARAADLWGNDFAIARAYFRLGLAELDAAELGAADEHLATALRIRERIGDHRGATNVREGLGLLALRSDPAEAVRILSLVVEEKRAQGGARRLGRALVNLGRALLTQGEPALAIEYLEEAERQFSTMPDADDYDHAPLGVLLGQAYQDLGQHSRAVAQVRSSLERAIRLQAHLAQAEAHQALGAMAEHSNDWGVALAEYRQAADILERWSTVEAARVVARMQALSGSARPEQPQERAD